MDVDRRIAIHIFEVLENVCKALGSYMLNVSVILFETGVEKKKVKESGFSLKPDIVPYRLLPLIRKML